MRTLAIALLASVTSAAACRSLPPGAVCWTLDGRPVPAPELPESRRAALDARVDAARLARDWTPEDPARWVALGRALANAGRFADAIHVYDEGLTRFPGDAALWRHRGHRRISLRDFGGAVDDLTRAAELLEGKPDEVEPPSNPADPAARPGSLRHAVYYHLGLAHYLRGEYEHAERAYRRCLEASHDDEARVAVLHWLHCTLRRLGRKHEADALLTDVHRGMAVEENRAYLTLVLLYKGAATPDECLSVGSGPSAAAAAYGVGNWLRDTGEETRGRVVLGDLLHREEWFAFGTIAAEADFARAGIRVDR